MTDKNVIHNDFILVWWCSHDNDEWTDQKILHHKELAKNELWSMNSCAGRQVSIHWSFVDFWLKNDLWLIYTCKNWFQVEYWQIRSVTWSQIQPNKNHKIIYWNQRIAESTTEVTWKAKFSNWLSLFDF